MIETRVVKLRRKQTFLHPKLRFLFVDLLVTDYQSLNTQMCMENIPLRCIPVPPPMHIHAHLVCSLTHKFKNRSHGVAMTPGATQRFFPGMRFPFTADLSETLVQSGL